MSASVRDHLNSGIARTVALLTAAGFYTVDSGDGETHDHHCDRDYGYVVCTVPHPEDMVAHARRMASVVTAAGLVVVSQMMEPPPPGHVFIEASYSPSDDIGIIDLSHVHDRMLASSPTELQERLDVAAEYCARPPPPIDLLEPWQQKDDER